MSRSGFASPFEHGLGTPPTRHLLGLDFADLSLAAVAARLAARPAGAPFSYVVTPNADHLVRLSRRPPLRPLYADAGLRLLDSRVVAMLARSMRLPVPLVVPGSDLVAALVDEVIAPGERVTILGMTNAAVSRLRDCTGLSAIAHHNPPMGFEKDPGAFRAALQFVEANPARFTFLAVGSPRQEAVAHALAERGLARGIGLCIGAALLFLSGQEKRAPRPVQQAGLEWAWRLAANPRRLARRYLVDSPAVVRLLRQEARARRGLSHGFSGCPKTLPWFSIIHTDAVDSPKQGRGESILPEPHFYFYEFQIFGGEPADSQKGRVGFGEGILFPP